MKHERESTEAYAARHELVGSSVKRRAAAAALYVFVLLCCVLAAIKLPSAAILVPLAAALIIPLLCFPLNCFAAAKVGISVKSAAACSRGESCRCEIVLRNAGIVPLPFVRCTLLLKNGMNGERRIVDVRCGAFAFSENRTEFFVGSSHCGCVSVRLLNAEISDCFGLFFKRVRIADAARTEAKCAFVPTVFNIDAVQSDAFSPDIESSEYAPGKRGTDYSEVLQLRPYEQGDSIKLVHWKASCKFDELIVREASFPIIRSLLICMDVSDCTAAECDAVADVTVSVCSLLSDSGTAFTLARPHGGDMEFLEVAAPDELPAAAEWLTECEPGGEAFAAYVEKHGSCDCGKVIFIGKEFSDSAADFCGESDTRRFLCRTDGGAYRAFSADNYAEDLSDIEL